MKRIWKWIKRQFELMSWACAWSESGAGLYVSAEEFFELFFGKEGKQKS